MGTTITREELVILNSLLNTISIDEHFTIMGLHCEHVLRQKYLKIDGSVDLFKYDLARNNFTDQGVYKHITDYLVD